MHAITKKCDLTSINQDTVVVNGLCVCVELLQTPVAGGLHLHLHGIQVHALVHKPGKVLLLRLGANLVQLFCLKANKVPCSSTTVLEKHTQIPKHAGTEKKQRNNSQR